MRDEGDLRAVPAAPARPHHRHRDDRLLLLQPGSGHGPGRFSDPAPPPVAKRRPGKADPIVDRPDLEAARPPRGGGGGVGTAVYSAAAVAVAARAIAA